MKEYECQENDKALVVEETALKYGECIVPQHLEVPVIRNEDDAIFLSFTQYEVEVLKKIAEGKGNHGCQINCRLDKPFEMLCKQFDEHRCEVKEEFREIRNEVASGFIRVDDEFVRVRAEMKEEFSNVRAEMKEQKQAKEMTAVSDSPFGGRCFGCVADNFNDDFILHDIPINVLIC